MVHDVQFCLNWWDGVNNSFSFRDCRICYPSPRLFSLINYLYPSITLLLASLNSSCLFNPPTPFPIPKFSSPLGTLENLGGASTTSCRPTRPPDPAVSIRFALICAQGSSSLPLLPHLTLSRNINQLFSPILITSLVIFLLTLFLPPLILLPPLLLHLLHFPLRFGLLPFS